MASGERVIKYVEATEAVEGARALSMEDIYKQTERRYKLTKVPISRRKNKYRPTAPDLSGVLDLSDQEGTEEKGLVRQFLVNIPELKAEAIRAYALTGEYGKHLHEHERPELSCTVTMIVNMLIRGAADLLLLLPNSSIHAACGEQTASTSFEGPCPSRRSCTGRGGASPSSPPSRTPT